MEQQANNIHPILENTPLEHFTVDMFFETFEYYFLIFNILGIAVYIMGELANSKIVKKDKFKLKKWWSDNSFRTILSILTSFATLFIAMSYGIMNIALAIIIGFASDVFFKQIVKRFKPKAPNETKN